MNSIDLSARVEQLERENAALMVENETLRDAIASQTVSFPEEWRLTNSETKILKALLGPAETTTRESILAILHPDGCSTSIKSIDVMISHMRRKLPSGVGIVSVFGRGYRLTPGSREILEPYSSDVAYQTGRMTKQRYVNSIIRNLKQPESVLGS